MHVCLKCPVLKLFTCAKILEIYYDSKHRGMLSTHSPDHEKSVKEIEVQTFALNKPIIFKEFWKFLKFLQYCLIGTES